MKRLLLVALLAAALVGLAFGAGQSEEFPTKPLTIICPWSAGGGTDRTARFVADQLSDVIGQPVNVVNQTGGAGAVGHQAAANAAPDGYTLGNLTFEVNTLKYLGYSDVTPNDYIPVLQFNQDAAAVIVSADAPYDTVEDLLDDIRRQPEGTFSFSGSGIGTVWDLARIQMLLAADIDPNRVKYIPTQGAAPAITEMLGGHVDVITCSYPEAAPQIQAGDLKALAIMAEERNPQFAQVPTLKEEGLDFSYGTWRGFAVPLGTPMDRVEALQEALLEVVQSAEFSDFMSNNGFGVQVRVGDEFGDFMEEQFLALEEVFAITGYGDN
jgi:tripartite-type tricarboxylate transporter receptor subunit TctC